MPAEKFADCQAFVAGVFAEGVRIDVLFPRRLRDGVGVGSQREDVDEQRIIHEAAHAEIKQAVGVVETLRHVKRNPAEGEQAGPAVRPPRNELIPLHLVVDLPRELLDLGALEVLARDDRAGDEVRAVARGDAVDRDHPAGLAVHKVPEEAEVAFDVGLVRMSGVVPEDVHDLQRAVVSLLVRDPSALHADADGGEFEAGRRYLAGAVLGMIDGDARLGIDFIPEVAEDSMFEVVQKSAVLGRGRVQRRAPGGRAFRLARHFGISCPASGCETACNQQPQSKRAVPTHMIPAFLSARFGKNVSTIATSSSDYRQYRRFPSCGPCTHNVPAGWDESS